MDFTIKRPKSQRFSQLTFAGFRPFGKNKLHKAYKIWLSFIKALYNYFLLKLNQFLFIIYQFLCFLFELPKKLKDYQVRKLIWSRGRLGRPVATSIIMLVGFLVFVFGEFFTSFDFVVSKPIEADYLATTNDIIPKRTIATTTVPDIRKQSQAFVYKVEPGDSLFSIGAKFKISVDALKYVNGLSDTSVLRVGQDVTVPPMSGLIHKVEKGESLAAIAQKYDVAPQAVADFNYILDTSSLAVGAELVIPGAKVPEPVIPIITTPAVVPSLSYGSPSPSKSFCVWPTTVRIVTQNFSWYHNGLDIATPWGRGMPPLFSCTGGTVVRAGWDPFGLGLHVKIDHGNGYQSVYGHMSRIDVGYGQRVSRGQVIGLMGNTGRSTGPHVHFIVEFNGAAQNPYNYTN